MTAAVVDRGVHPVLLVRGQVAVAHPSRDAVVTRERESWRETVRPDETGNAWQNGKSARNAWSRNPSYMFNGIKRTPLRLEYITAGQSVVFAATTRV
jgi:hypothetical protein